MRSPVTQRILLILALQSVLAIIGLFVTENVESWPALVITWLVGLAPLVLLLIYVIGFRELSIGLRLLLGAAVLFGFIVAVIFLFLAALSSVYMT